jgi:hypothetical protein
MRFTPEIPAASHPDPRDTPLDSERDQISQNINAVQDVYTRAEQNISRSHNE